MPITLETYRNYDPSAVEYSFVSRGWESERIKVSNFDIRQTTFGAALECGDGRFDQIDRKMFGPRVLGAANAIAALKTGGDLAGLERAAEESWKLGYAPGTHGAEHEGEGCGLFGLWRQGKLKSAIHPFELPLSEAALYFGVSESEWIRLYMSILGGKHFTLPGIHQEKALIYNPFKHTAVNMTDGSRFKQGDWFLAELGIPFPRRMLFAAETVEQLKPDAKKIEILIP